MYFRASRLISVNIAIRFIFSLIKSYIQHRFLKFDAGHLEESLIDFIYTLIFFSYLILVVHSIIPVLTLCSFNPLNRSGKFMQPLNFSMQIRQWHQNFPIYYVYEM